MSTTAGSSSDHKIGPDHVIFGRHVHGRVFRGGDRKIKGALMVDTLRQAEAEALGEKLSKQFPGADTGVFRVLCQLGRGDL